MTNQSSLPLEPVDAALEAIRRLDNALSKCGEIKTDALPRRARQAPQLILQAGLVPAIAFFLSKLDSPEKRNAYAAAVKAILEPESNSRDKRICNNTGGEGGGYPHIAALILAYAASQIGCHPNDIERIDSKLLDCLKKIGSKGVYLERLVVSYAEEIKMLATALYGE